VPDSRDAVEGIKNITTVVEADLADDRIMTRMRQLIWVTLSHSRCYGRTHSAFKQIRPREPSHTLCDDFDRWRVNTSERLSQRTQTTIPALFVILEQPSTSPLVFIPAARTGYSFLL
jgi:hypothetical protein